jgi:predicted transcriptional regulator
VANPQWTYLSNHGHVLVALSRDSEVRLRDVAVQVGITERAVQGIVSDLVTAGHVVKGKAGRRNTYRVRRHARFRHPLESGVRLGDFLDVVNAQPE